VIAVSDRVQVGPKVDATLWKRLREDVEERKGSVRGNLGDELDNAIREYLRHEERPVDQRIEKRIARIEEAVGAAPTDGGTDTVPEREHTHTRPPTPTEKPPSNTGTDKKVAWLAKCLRDNHGDDFQEVTRDDLRGVIKQEYGFRRDTAKRYVEHLVDHFDLMTHPATDKVLVTEERHAELEENMKDGLHKEAQDEFPDEYEAGYNE